MLLLALLEGLALPACTPKDTFEVQITPELVLGRQYDLTLSRTTKYTWDFTKESSSAQFDYALLLDDGRCLPFVKASQSSSIGCYSANIISQNFINREHICTHDIFTQKQDFDSLLFYLDCKKYVLPLHLKDAAGELYFVASLKNQPALCDSTSVHLVLP